MKNPFQRKSGSEPKAIAPEAPEPDLPKVLILTPVKDAALVLTPYLRNLSRLTYPHKAISIGILESDSSDDTVTKFQQLLPVLRQNFRRASFWKKDFGYHLPPGIYRGDEGIQLERRSILARSRNHLLFRALDDEEWVLWLDSDVIDYPPDLIEQLLATGRDILHPNCVLTPGGPTWDTNGWRDHGRLHLDDLKSEGDLVELDAVGGTVLMIRADLHRDGLIFPPFPFGVSSPYVRPGRGEVETEGLGIMAREMGHTPWGLPNLEVRHLRR